MSKLTDIQYRIDQLDGGAFQNLCDAYLTCKGYGIGYSLGMRTGTNKTAKGIPDTYFLKEDGKYVFVMYTTQKDDFVKKALQDLEKCFDANKTGIPAENVGEIVYCHTCGRLSAGDTQTLNEFCKARNSKLTLIGLDNLGSDIYWHYPRIAKDFLEVSVDTGQIMSIQDFVQVHDANKMSAPLGTKFELREAELNEAKEKLNLSDVLILSGPAGVGKTRLALQICRELASENGYEILCIKSNGLELYEDLVTTIEEDKNYLAFVDDANELTGLHLVLDFLCKTADQKKSVKKLIVTVRDYARQQVISQILEVKKPSIIKVGSGKYRPVCGLRHSFRLSRRECQARTSSSLRESFEYRLGSVSLSFSAALMAKSRLNFTMQLVKRLLLVMPQYSSGPLQNIRSAEPSG